MKSILFLLHSRLPRPSSLRLAFGLAFIMPAGLAASSPFVDVVQFGQPEVWPFSATERVSNLARVTGKVDYNIRPVSIIDRAMYPGVCKFPMRKTADGKWIPTQTTFKMVENSYANIGGVFLGRIVGSEPSAVTLDLSADGVITATLTHATTNLGGAGLAYSLTGSMSWKGTEILDLKTGRDDWNFEATLDAIYNFKSGWLPPPPAKGTLVAASSRHRDFKLVPTIDESHPANAPVAAASNPPVGSAGDSPVSTGERALLIEGLSFHNSAGNPVLRFNDAGVLSVAVINHSGVDLAGLEGRITTTEKTHGILNYDKLYGSFRVAREGKLDLPIELKTDYGVPPEGVHVVVTFTYHSTMLAQKTLVLPTESFFHHATVTAPDYNSPRLKAVAKYFGWSHTPYVDPAKELADAAAQGDELAAMWEAIFYSTGNGGYKADPEKAFHEGKAALKKVEALAREGNAEALYLLFYACQLGLEGDTPLASGSQFLERAASADFLPAKYDRAREMNYRKDYANAARELKKVHEAGVQLAATVLGTMYEKGFGVDRDPQAALAWYDKAAAFGDPEALLCQANIYAAGFGDTPPDAGKALELANQAAAKNCPAALVFIGNAYLSGRAGVPQNISTAIKSFKTAADSGDRQAMLALGETYLLQGPGFATNERAALFWIKKAAERDSPAAMLILANSYNEGKLIEKDTIAGRYWYNQAAIHGLVIGDRRGVEAAQQTFVDFWNHADFSPSYIYVNEYGQTVGDSGDSLLNGMLGGVIASMREYYGHLQQMIDGLEYIRKKNGRKIYGGTVSSHFISPLQLHDGQTISVQSYGIVSTGMMSGLADANGLGPNWPEYRVVPTIPCSAVMGQVQGGPWQLLGTQARFKASKDGPLCLALNAVDYRNYKGYFDLVIEVPEEE